MTPSVGEIRAQIAAVLEHDAEARTIGMFSPGVGQWPETIAIGRREFMVRYCDSVLAFRQALRAAHGNGVDGTVLLTALSDRELGADVLARLARGRLFRVRQWEMIRNAFRAASVDARLASYGWMAELLIERMPTEGYAPVPSGVLDADTAWRTLLRVSLGLEVERLDLDSLLRWTVSEDAAIRWRALPEEAPAGIARWVEETLGGAAHLLMGILLSGWLSDALPLGLVGDLVFGGDETPVELAAAAVRLERFTSGRRLDADAGRKWADAAVRVVRVLEANKARTVLARADQLLSELHLQSLAGTSSVLSAGFTARVGEFADRLQRFVAQPGQGNLNELERAGERIRAHTQAAAAPSRMERIEMAVRLARWLSVEEPPPAGFSAEVTRYVTEGAYVDWARWKLLGGDAAASLSEALNGLAERVHARREEENQLFAAALKRWNDAPGALDPVVPVERVLSTVVAPLAGVAPVLLLVVDGLSLPVFYELAADLQKLGWESCCPAEGGWTGAAMATLPTVTEVSRASLFAGQLTSGTQHAEKSGFARHPALLPYLRARPPLIYHKGDLSEGVGLAADLQEALRTPELRVLAVVYNAIDDQLDGASQLHLQWSLDNLRLLSSVLHEAQGAGRIVVLTSDHGHVIDHESRLRAGGEGDRWRPAEGSVEPGEIEIKGGRVLTPSGARAVTLPWSERLRYGPKKAGYHGGASPQEVLVPLAVLARFGMTVPGWRPAVMGPPDWWYAQRGGEGLPMTAEPKRPAALIPLRAAVAAQPDLFSVPEKASGERATGPDWIHELQRSALYKTQKALAARVAPADESLRRLLEALSARGGKLAVEALATRLDMPVLRVPGFLSAARRVLNVDQAPVLRIDEVSGTVELNRPLLDAQFELKAPRQP